MNQLKNIFITGATGFIGSDLLKIIDFDKYNVFALSRQTYNSTQINLNYLQADLFDLDKFSEILSVTDFFIHIAGEKKDESKMKLINEDGMSYILSVISKYAGIKFLYISSGGVYGIENHPETILDENVKCYPTTLYEKTKLNAEFLLSEIAETNKLHYTILRPTNVVGAFDKGMKLLNLFNALQKKRFFYINKKSIVNYLYVRQLTEIIKNVIDNEIFENEVYNVNSACTIEEFIEQSKKALNLHYKIKMIPLVFSGLLLMIAKLADLLPPKYQLINSGKLRELTSEKYYSTKKIHQKLTINESAYLKTGIENLVMYYKSINKL